MLTIQSLQPLVFQKISTNAVVLDVGSGAGMPGLPIKFARPDIAMTLLEPRRKRYLFLKRVIDELKLENIDVIRGRLEDVSGDADFRKRFDLITTRGTGGAAKLFPFMASLLAPNGVIWFYKGAAAQREASTLKSLTSKPITITSIDDKMSLLSVGAADKTDDWTT